LIFKEVAPTRIELVSNV